HDSGVGRGAGLAWLSQPCAAAVGTAWFFSGHGSAVGALARSAADVGVQLPDRSDRCRVLHDGRVLRAGRGAARLAAVGFVERVAGRDRARVPQRCRRLASGGQQGRGAGGERARGFARLVRLDRAGTVDPAVDRAGQAAGRASGEAGRHFSWGYSPEPSALTTRSAAAVLGSVVLVPRYAG